MKKNSTPTEQILKYPRETTITGRSSTIRGSFIKAIIPIIRASEKERQQCLDILGQNKKQLFCSYCGDTATEWDHFRPIVTKKGASGYVTDVYNLVPSCGKCNQSKSGSEWNLWIVGNAPRSPKRRGVKNVDEKIKVLQRFYDWSEPKTKQMPKEFLEGEAFKLYMKSCEKLISSLKKFQIKAEAIKVELGNFKG
jgi:5-methylcytosine-specific restriction endonuclease McrA